MQDRILKFPKPLKENKTVSNEPNLRPNMNHPLQREKSPAIYNPQSKKPLTNEELAKENQALLAAISRKEEKLHEISKNDRLQGFFNMKDYLFDTYKEYIGMLSELKTVKTAQSRQFSKYLPLFSAFI